MGAEIKLKHWIKIALSSGLILLLVLGGSTAFAQDISMRPVSELGSEGVTPEVIGGDPATPANWPATLIFLNKGGGGCTATVVGEKVVLTAAHCVEDGQTALVKFGANQVRLTCSHHPAYPADISADFALCNASQSMSIQPYEKVNSNAGLLQLNTTVQLLGYGCRTVGGGDRNFGSLYRGLALVTRTPSINLYITTRSGAAVCFGDSGGGAYVYTNPAQTRRTLIGVNSRGDISQYSWLSSTSNAVFGQWAKAWSTMHDVKICGVHKNALGCRGD